MLILLMYAEEYLDDFQYRHALFTGNLWPILATVKLLSPIKLVVACINTVILSLACTANYLLEEVARSLVEDFMEIYSSEINWWRIVILSLETLIFIAILGNVPKVFFQYFQP